MSKISHALAAPARTRALRAGRYLFHFTIHALCTRSPSHLIEEVTLEAG